MKLFVAALAGACLCPAFAVAHNHSSPAERYFAHRCDQSHSLACVHRAALHWGVSYSYMKGISYRESRWNPYAKNPSSTASGLFQFLTSTFYGGWNPYRGQDIWSAKSNSLAAAYAMHLGYYSWWTATS
jgi:hypothetical protein